MLQALYTGHDGAISTIHANSPRDALSRLETLVLMAGIVYRYAPSGSRSAGRSTWWSR